MESCLPNESSRKRPLSESSPDKTATNNNNTNVKINQMVAEYFRRNNKVQGQEQVEVVHPDSESSETDCQEEDLMNFYMTQQPDGCLEELEEELEAEEEEEEEETETESEFECDDWDSDCRVSNVRPSHSIVGYHLMPTCNKDPHQSPFKRRKTVTPEIRSDLLTDRFKETLRQNWNDNQKCTTDEQVELIVDPFKMCVVRNLLEDSTFLDAVLEDFNLLHWNRRMSDLFELSQSKDLKSFKNMKRIVAVRNFLKNDVMKWVAELTGFELVDISVTCSFYSNTDYLLVHDDQRDDRMVAFVLYLTRPNGWRKENGGALQLLDTDENGHPRNVVRDVLPSHNQFVFFPVTNKSYHQVAEVTSMAECRYSINGWFHTKTPPIFDIAQFEPRTGSLYGPSTIKSCDIDISLDCWLKEDYLHQKTAERIRTYFEKHSEISLTDFLTDECFNELSLNLQSDCIKWEKVGPPDRYCYEVAKTDDDSLPHVLDRFVKLFQSKKMFAMLKRYTKLSLNTTEATMKFELQRWTPGCYALLTDFKWEQEKELDVVMYFGCKDGSEVLGARTQYVSVEDEIEEAHITLDPRENNLNIVYRDTARLTKYYSKQSKCKCFYVLFCSYAE